MFGFFRRVSIKKFLIDLNNEVSESNVSNGAAAIAFFLMLAIFPAIIFLLALLPYLPIEHLKEAIFDSIAETMPGRAADLVFDIVDKVTSQRQGGLLSFGLIFAIWSASAGINAIMMQLNTTYEVEETRPYWKSRGTSLLLTIVYFVTVIAGFALIVMGGVIQSWAASLIGWSEPLLVFFAVFRWAVIVALLLFAFACIYYMGPNKDQKFIFVTPGNSITVVIFIIASVLFRIYVVNFSNYDATYGSIGAVIVLMMWLYIVGWVILLGGEINALVERYNADFEGRGEGRESG
jgi:membrane protein